MKANAMILMLDSSDEDDLEVYEVLLQFERNKVTIKAASSVGPDFLFYCYKNGLDCFTLIQWSTHTEVSISKFKKILTKGMVKATMNQ